MKAHRWSPLLPIAALILLASCSAQVKPAPPSPAPAPALGNAAAERDTRSVVKSYYDALARQDFPAAYALLSQGQQQRVHSAQDLAGTHIKADLRRKRTQAVPSKQTGNAPPISPSRRFRRPFLFASVKMRTPEEAAR